MTKPACYIDVILPLPLPKLYTYGSGKHTAAELHQGSRVTVQFGKKKLYTALVYKVHNSPPESYETKDILSVLDDDPLVTPLQITFWQWLADYYMCTVGEVFKAALPSGLKLESETRIFPVNDEELSGQTFTEQEELVIRVLKTQPFMNIRDIADAAGKTDVLSLIRDMLDKNLIKAEETLKENYRPKMAAYVRLAFDATDDKRLHSIFDSLEKAPKQLELLMSYISLSHILTKGQIKEVIKGDLLKKSNVSASVLNELIKKNILEIHDKEIGRLQFDISGQNSPNELNEAQKNALAEIRLEFEKKEVVLLHGVTSSGKTEIYIHLIDEQIRQGKQVLYLLPEIALTAQIINRLKMVFGDKIGIYHSKFPDSERVEIWKNILGKGPASGKYQVILGVRSSVFLPFSNLGLIIVDEEHENTYKQFDPAPRYNARDAAVVLAGLHHAKVLMGTATPSLESYYNAKTGKYGLVTISERYREMKLPEIRVVDVREARRKKRMQSHFTPQLLENIETALNNKEQVILFQNRRGFSPYLECETCGWVPHCKHCDVSLTYHKQHNQLICHYCGYTINNPHACEACGSASLQTRGFGTEKIEDEIALFFPDAAVARMDLDSTRTRKSYEKIIHEFETGKINILIGTQMVSKGLDFNHVRVVGILNADNMLNFPDFRAYERSYQLMAQVSGRAGRKYEQGKVIIQTSDPGNPIIKNVTENNYEEMYSGQLAERKEFSYPPFVRLMQVTVKHKKQTVVEQAAEALSRELRITLGKRVIGPEYPLVNRIQNWYLKSILLKLEKEKSILAFREHILNAILKVKSTDKFRSVQIVIDVDPM